MVCDSWKAKLDTYLDGELPEQELRAFDAHVRGCAPCAADALARVQIKRAIQVAGKRFTPSAEFRKKVRQSVAPTPQRRLRPGWIFTSALALVFVAAALTLTYWATESGRDQLIRNQVYSEIADLHVDSLASSSPVDVVSADRHTVKPWFQGKIPFAFDLPELQNTGFTLLGGRMAYLDQAPGAHLIYNVRKHHISVFVFQERLLPAGLGENSFLPMSLAFRMETWSQNGLRYFVIGDTGVSEIESLAKLFKGN